MKDYKELISWQKAMLLAMEIYKLTEMLPREERFGLSDQLRRACVSVPSNIAEGVSRISDKEKAHFIEISYGSLLEVLCQMEISNELGYITVDQYQEIEVKVERLSKLLSSLRHKYLTRNNN